MAGLMVQTAAWALLLFAMLPAWQHDAYASEDMTDDLFKWIPNMRAQRALGGSLKNISEEYRVVVVMTTIPPRMHSIEPVIDSMLAQTWPVAELYLNIPHKYNRTGEAYIIPDWLHSKKGVSIVRCEDLGPGTHLLNGLRLEKDPWTFLAVVDDDHIYGHDLVETLMRAALAYPGSAVAAQGFLSVPGLLRSPEIESIQSMGYKRPRYLHDQGFASGPVLVSYLGVVYQRGFFDDSVFDYSGASEQCRYQDDMWFSAHLARKGIVRRVLGAALGVQELTNMHLGPESLTFWDDNKPRAISDDCNRALLSQHPQIWAYRRRVVLALGGLPPPPPLESQTAVSKEWRSAMDAVKRMSRLPDLTYLCTEGWRGKVQEDSSEMIGGSSHRSTGASFSLDGVLVTGSDACKPHEAEPRVGQLISDPLQWEGDPHTVIVLGSLSDLTSNDADNIWAAADCAAEMFRVSQEEAAADDSGELRGREGSGQKDADVMGVEMSSSLFRSRSRIFGVGDIGLQRGDPDAGERTWPFCRLGGFTAVSVGSFSQMQRR
ncbi:unnamed protein product [Polarella glacialis]|uniref:Glycosyltransferase 2-like domain-containing protein n=1 Tax=Polarella glacialis TaxID=89957 RepID=A0A813GU04_POLGL|nr:unnamed protein product [Polarella glacialis]